MSQTKFTEKTISYRPVEGQRVYLRLYDANEVDSFVQQTVENSLAHRDEVRKLKVQIIDQTSEIYRLKMLIKEQAHPAHKQP